MFAVLSRPAADELQIVTVGRVSDLRDAVAAFNSATTRSARKMQSNEILDGLRSLSTAMVQRHAADIVSDLSGLEFALADQMLEQIINRAQATQSKLSDPREIENQGKHVSAWMSVAARVAAAASARAALR